MKSKKYFSRHLAWMWGSKQLLRGKPDVWGNRRQLVSGRTRKYLALQYTKILQSSTKLRIRPRTMGKMGQTNHEAMRKGRPGRLCEGERCCDSTCWKVPYIGQERGKLREVNPVSAINTDEEKSGKRRTEACGNFAPLPHMTHSPPHTQWFITSSWPLGG